MLHNLRSEQRLLKDMLPHIISMTLDMVLKAIFASGDRVF